MNLVKYMMNKKYREKYQTEFSQELTGRSVYEFDEREKLLKEAVDKEKQKK